MEWMNKSDRGGQAPHTQPTQHAPGQPVRPIAPKGSKLPGKQIVVAALIAVLLVAFAGIGAMALKGGEKRLVKADEMQAVFLNGGQVYFGDIDDINQKSLELSNIYYLRVNQQVQPNQTSAQAGNDISLVKLGCELHGPQDKMVINREQVIFWENLKKDGQVAQAVEKYKADNPQGQSCSQQASTGTTDTTQTQTTPTTNTNTGTTGTGNNQNNTNTGNNSNN